MMALAPANLPATQRLRSDVRVCLWCPGVAGLSSMVACHSAGVLAGTSALRDLPGAFFAHAGTPRPSPVPAQFAYTTPLQEGAHA